MKSLKISVIGNIEQFSIIFLKSRNLTRGCFIQERLDKQVVVYFDNVKFKQRYLGILKDFLFVRLMEWSEISNQKSPFERWLLSKMYLQSIEVVG